MTSAASDAFVTFVAMPTFPSSATSPRREARTMITSRKAPPKNKTRLIIVLMWSSPRDEDAPHLRFKADVMNDDYNGAIFITPCPAHVRVQDGLIRHVVFIFFMEGDSIHFSAL